MNTRRSRRRSQSGQAIIEYILILVVVIAIALILAKSFFKPFQDWTTNFYDTYVTCLLDEGELPTLGGDGNLKDCEATGDFPKDGSHGQSSATGSGGTDPNANSKDKNGSKSNAQNGSDSDQNRKRPPRGSEVSRNGGRFTHERVSATDGISSNRTGPIVAEAETKAEKNRGTFRIRRLDTGLRVTQGKPQMVSGLSGLLASEREKIKKRQEKIVHLPVEESSSVATGKKKFDFSPVSRRQVASDLVGDSWSFGKLLRILLILLIVIALVLVISGQMVQISKGAEK